MLLARADLLGAAKQRQELRSEEANMMITSADKRLNEMDDLRDMGRFPIPIYVGATGNILQTILLTYSCMAARRVRPRCPCGPGRSSPPMSAR